MNICISIHTNIHTHVHTHLCMCKHSYTFHTRAHMHMNHRIYKHALCLSHTRAHTHALTHNRQLGTLFLEPTSRHPATTAAFTLATFQKVNFIRTNEPYDTYKWKWVMLNTQTNQHIWMIELQPAHWQYPPPPSSPSTTQPTHIHTHTFSLPSLISLISLSLFCSAFFSPTSTPFLFLRGGVRFCERGRQREAERFRENGWGGWGLPLWRDKDVLRICMINVMYTIEPCHVYQWIISHISKRHVTHMNECHVSQHSV